MLEVYATNFTTLSCRMRTLSHSYTRYLYIATRPQRGLMNICRKTPHHSPLSESTYTRTRAYTYTYRYTRIALNADSLENCGVTKFELVQTRSYFVPTSLCHALPKPPQKKKKNFLVKYFRVPYSGGEKITVLVSRKRRVNFHYISPMRPPLNTLFFRSGIVDASII